VGVWIVGDRHPPKEKKHHRNHGSKKMWFPEGVAVVADHHPLVGDSFLAQKNPRGHLATCPRSGCGTGAAGPGATVATGHLNPGVSKHFHGILCHVFMLVFDVMYFKSVFYAMHSWC